MRDSTRLRVTQTHSNMRGAEEEAKNGEGIDGTRSYDVAGGHYSHRALFVEFSPCQAAVESNFEI